MNAELDAAEASDEADDQRGSFGLGISEFLERNTLRHRWDKGAGICARSRMIRACVRRRWCVQNNRCSGKKDRGGINKMEMEV